MIRILIASTGFVARAALERLVRQTEGVEVVSSLVGAEALEAMVAQWHPDLVVTDSAELAGADFPTIVVSAEAAAEPELGLGIRGVLSADATAGQLRAAIDGVLAGLWVMHPRAAGTSAAVGAAEADGPLSKREREVLGMVAEGLGNKIIASRLGISENTVKFHVSSILEKLGADSRTEAVTRGIRRGLVLV